MVIQPRGGGVKDWPGYFDGFGLIRTFFFHEWVTPITPFIILTNYYMQLIVYVWVGKKHCIFDIYITCNTGNGVKIERKLLKNEFYAFEKI